MTNEEAIEKLKKEMEIKRKSFGIYSPHIEMAIKALSADKTAELCIVGETTMHYECSQCGGAVDKWDNYCKHCGARMKNESE